MPTSNTQTPAQDPNAYKNALEQAKQRAEKAREEAYAAAEKAHDEKRKQHIETRKAQDAYKYNTNYQQGLDKLREQNKNIIANESFSDFGGEGLTYMPNPAKHSEQYMQMWLDAYNKKHNSDYTLQAIYQQLQDAYNQGRNEVTTMREKSERSWLNPKRWFGSKYDTAEQEDWVREQAGKAILSTDPISTAKKLVREYAIQGKENPFFAADPNKVK